MPSNGHSKEIHGMTESVAAAASEVVRKAHPTGRPGNHLAASLCSLLRLSWKIACVVLPCKKFTPMSRPAFPRLNHCVFGKSVAAAASEVCKAILGNKKIR